MRAGESSQEKMAGPAPARAAMAAAVAMADVQYGSTRGRDSRCDDGEVTRRVARVTDDALCLFAVVLSRPVDGAWWQRDVTREENG